MTEPTAEEIRSMCEWAGVKQHVAVNYSAGQRWELIAWNDGRLLLAMIDRLATEDSVSINWQAPHMQIVMVECGEKYATGFTLPEAIWLVCREVRK